MLQKLKTLTLSAILAASSLTGCDYNGVDNTVNQIDLKQPNLRSPLSCSPDAKIRYFRDVDGDGFGGLKSDFLDSCFQPQGYVPKEDALDCNDHDATVNPSASELCNGRDDNCNGEADEGLEIISSYLIPKKIQFVMDNSGSMSVVDFYRVRFEAAAAAVKGSEWQDEYAGRVAVFGSDVRTYGSFTSDRQILANTLLTAEYADVGVSTDFVKIFSDMIKNISDDNSLDGSQRAILYVGDGQPTDSEGYLLDPERVTELNQLAVDKGVTIYSLTLEKGSSASTAMDELTAGIGYNLPLDLQGMDALQSSTAAKSAVEDLLVKIEDVKFSCYEGVPEPIVDY